MLFLWGLDDSIVVATPCWLGEVKLWRQIHLPVTHWAGRGTTVWRSQLCLRDFFSNSVYWHLPETFCAVFFSAAISIFSLSRKPLHHILCREMLWEMFLPIAGRLELKGLKGPFQPKPLCNSMIYCLSSYIYKHWQCWSEFWVSKIHCLIRYIDC